MKRMWPALTALEMPEYFQANDATFNSAMRTQEYNRESLFYFTKMIRFSAG